MTSPAWHTMHEGHEVCEQEEALRQRNTNTKTDLTNPPPIEDDPSITHEPTEKERY